MNDMSHGHIQYFHLKPGFSTSFSDGVPFTTRNSSPHSLSNDWQDWKIKTTGKFGGILYSLASRGKSPNSLRSQVENPGSKACVNSPLKLVKIVQSLLAFWIEKCRQWNGHIIVRYDVSIFYEHDSRAILASQYEEGSRNWPFQITIYDCIG